MQSLDGGVAVLPMEADAHQAEDEQQKAITAVASSIDRYAVMNECDQGD
jgi:hypothetical protein